VSALQSIKYGIAACDAVSANVKNACQLFFEHADYRAAVFRAPRFVRGQLFHRVMNPQYKLASNRIYPQAIATNT